MVTYEIQMLLLKACLRKQVPDEGHIKLAIFWVCAKTATVSKEIAQLVNKVEN